jgi:hypothetical protein
LLISGCRSVGDPSRASALPTVRETSLILPAQRFEPYLVAFEDERAPYEKLEVDRSLLVPLPTEYQSLEVENDFLSLSLLPELGGKVYRFENRTTGHNQFYENPSGLKINPWGRHGWWFALGGTELMAPFDEHGGMVYLPFSPKVEERADGLVVRMEFSEERHFGVSRWEATQEVFLPAEAAYFDLTVTLRNGSEKSRPLQAWLNTLIAPGPGNMVLPTSRELQNVDHQLLFGPAVTELYNHNDNNGAQFWGGPWDTVAWPLHRSGGREVDISRLALWHEYDLQYAGLFLPSRQHSRYIGQYDLIDDEGVAIVIPPQERSDTAGLKYWYWGSFSDIASPAFSDGSTTYAELMVGDSVVFEEMSRPGEPHPTGEPFQRTVPPDGVVRWTQRYLAPFGIGAPTLVTDTGALRFARNDAGVEVGVYSAVERKITELVIEAHGEVLRRLVRGVSTGPGERGGPLFRQIELPEGVPLGATLRCGFSDGTVWKAPLSSPQQGAGPTSPGR